MTRGRLRFLVSMAVQAVGVAYFIATAVAVVPLAWALRWGFGIITGLAFLVVVVSSLERMSAALQARRSP